MKKRVFISSVIMVTVLAAYLSGCGNKSPKASGLTNSAAPTESSIAPSGNGNMQTAPSIEDQLNFEKTIRNFAENIENKKFGAAEQYCSSDFNDYLQSLLDGSGGVADNFSLAITKGYALKLSEVKGYYENGTAQPDYNISDEKPTLNFNVTFEFVNSDGQKETAGGYVTAVKSENGDYLIGGFASGQ